MIIFIMGFYPPILRELSGLLWYTPQMTLAQRRENSSGQVQSFAGLVKCADCSFLYECELR